MRKIRTLTPLLIGGLLAALAPPSRAEACEVSITTRSAGNEERTDQDCTPSGDAPGWISLIVTDEASSDPVPNANMNWYEVDSYGTANQRSIGLCGQTNDNGILVVASKPLLGDMVMSKRGYEDCLVEDQQVASGIVLEITIQMTPSPDGTLEGRIYQCGEPTDFVPLPGATVELTLPDSETAIESTTTNDNGEYRFVAPAGRYDMRVFLGSTSNHVRGLEIESNTTTAYDHRLCSCPVPDESGDCPAASCRMPEGFLFGRPGIDAPQMLDLGEGQSPLYVDTGDLNGDGLTDFVVARNTSEDRGISLFYQKDSGDAPRRTLGFDEVRLSTANTEDCQDSTGRGDCRGRAPESVYIRDFNKDGRPDILVGKKGLLPEEIGVAFQRTVTLFVQREDGTFSDEGDNSQISSTCTGTSEIGIGNLDGDDYPDIVAASGCSKSLKRLFNTTPNPIPGEEQYVFDKVTDVFANLSTGHYRGIVVDDINSDGRDDVISADEFRLSGVPDSGVNYLFVLYANSLNPNEPDRINDLRFYKYRAGKAPWGVTTGDVNKDGRTDVVVANQDNGTLSVFLQEGAPDFLLPNIGQEISLGAATESTLVRLGDLDNDGFLDAVVSNADNPAPTISLMRGNGTAELFDSPGCLLGEENGGTRGIALADMDGDGRLDIVATNPDSNTVAIYRQIFDNVPPPEPTLANPLDGSLLDTTRPIFVINNVVDPDGDALEYEYEVATDIDFAAEHMLDSGKVPDAGGETTEFQLTQALVENQTYYVRIRAREADPSLGKASEFSSENNFLAASGGLGSIQDCFIATAAYGTPFEPEVKVLREFRDRWLKTSVFGRKFVNWYYQNSPEVASVIREKTILRGGVRIALLPVAGVAAGMNWLDRAGFSPLVPLLLSMLTGLAWLSIKKRKQRA